MPLVREPDLYVCGTDCIRLQTCVGKGIGRNSNELPCQQIGLSNPMNYSMTLKKKMGWSNKFENTLIDEKELNAYFFI